MALPIDELQRTCDVVRACDGNRSRAAKKLKITPHAVKLRLETAAKRGLDVPEPSHKREPSNNLRGNRDKKPPAVNKKPPTANKTAPAANNLAPGAMAPDAKDLAIPPLSEQAQQRWEQVDKESRRELWKKWAREGKQDDSLLNYLVAAEQPQLERMAFLRQRTMPSCVSIDELISGANFRIAAEVRNYDPEQTEFWTWASSRVFGGMVDHVREQDHASRSDRQRQKLRLQWSKKFFDVHDRAPTGEEIRAKFGWSQEQYERSYPAAIESIDTEYQAGDKLQSMKELLAAWHDCPGQAMEDDAFWEEMTRGLSMDELVMFYLYWKRQVTMKRLGMVLDLSESRISQMMKGLMERIAERLIRERNAA